MYPSIGSKSDSVLTELSLLEVESQSSDDIDDDDSLSSGSKDCEDSLSSSLSDEYDTGNISSALT